MPPEHQPLLPSDRLAAASRRPPSLSASARHRTKRFLTSKPGHYSVLLLVSLDISSIFADLILQLMTCEGRVPGPESRDAQKALGIVSLVFSCLFMVELVASVWAFDAGYFGSWFHCLDAAVITASFVVDVVLRGVVEEVGSLIIVLRLFRVFKVSACEVNVLEKTCSLSYAIVDHRGAQCRRRGADGTSACPHRRIGECQSTDGTGDRRIEERPSISCVESTITLTFRCLRPYDSLSYRCRDRPFTHTQS